MRILLILLLLTFNAFSYEWVLDWSDEFDNSDSTVDASKWTFVTYGNKYGWWNNELENYTTAEYKNAWTENGNLVIEARKERLKWPGDTEYKDYTSARLVTKNKADWTYGKFDIRAKLPKGSGMWPAIWLLSTDDNYGGWPKSGEIDIMEAIGTEENIVHHTVHTESYNHTKNTQKETHETLDDIYNTFHTYSVVWTPEKIVFYVDDDSMYRFDNEHNTYAEWPFDQDFHIILNVAVGGWGGTVDTTVLPQRMYVDYVRVYKEKDNFGIKDTLPNSVLESLNKKENLVIYPNPFNPTTTIVFKSNISKGNIAIYNINGKLIQTYNNIKKGINKFHFTTHQKSSGIYIVKVQQGNTQINRKMILLK